MRILHQQQIEINELQKALAKKDKEIETLNKTIFRIENEKANIIQKEKIDYLSFALQIRKQVCDEIRDKAKWSCPNDLKWTIKAKDLDQIEKGENNAK